MEEKVTVSLVITFLFVCLFTTPPSFFIFLWCMTANMWRRWHRKWRSQGQDGCVSLEGFNVMSEQLSVSACVWSPYPPPTRLTPHTNQWLELDIWTASPVSPPQVTLPYPLPNLEARCWHFGKFFAFVQRREDWNQLDADWKLEPHLKLNNWHVTSLILNPHKPKCHNYNRF